MSESQSRYSIVERLTQRKLDIMSSKSELKEILKHKEQEVEELRKELLNWDQDIEEDVKRVKRRKEREIEKMQQECRNLKERMTEKEEVYDEKVKAIEEALNSIQEISKTATTS